MNIIIVDDEQIILYDMMDTIAEIFPEAKVEGFTNPLAAIEFVKDNPCDVALLDIQMPVKTGLEVAKELKDIKPNINIIFATGYSQYALDAFSLNASGYIMKPATTEAIRNAFDNLRNPIVKKNEMLYVRCFGNFDIFYDNNPLIFKRSKAKELFAYLVNLNGSSCSANELCAVLWEDSPDTESVKNNLRNLVSELNRVLKEYGAEDAFIHKKNHYAVDKTKIDCDFYRYMDYDTSAINLYKGEYMTQYSWAEITHAYLEKNHR